MLAIREALLARDWPAADAAIQRVDALEGAANNPAEIVALVAKETNDARGQVAYFELVGALTSAVSSGNELARPQTAGETYAWLPDRDHGKLGVDPLRDALQRSSVVVSKYNLQRDGRVAGLSQLAAALLPLRAALVSGDWDAAETSLAKARAAVGAPPGDDDADVAVYAEAKGEVDQTGTEVENHGACVALRAGLAVGGIHQAGELGELDHSRVSADAVVEALEAAARLDLRTAETDAVSGVATAVRTLRSCFTKEETKRRGSLYTVDWDEVTRLAGGIVEDPRVRDARVGVAVAKEEAEFAVLEHLNAQVMTALDRVLNEGKVGGAIGALDTSGVDLAAAEKRFEEVKALGGCVSRNARQLETAARLVRDLRRSCVVGGLGGWEQVGAVLQAAFGELPEGADTDDFLEREGAGAAAAAVLNSAALAETTLVWNELTDRRTIARVQTALEADQLQGPIDRLQVHTVRCEGLTAALAAAAKRRTRSALCESLELVGQVVAQLRKLVLKARGGR